MNSKSVSHKVFPLSKRQIKLEIPTINFAPKHRNSVKVLPELADSTTSNSKSNSFIQHARSQKKTHSLILRDSGISSSDSLSYEEYKKAEILRARRILASRFPYWFIDSYNDFINSRSLRQNILTAPESFNKIFNSGLKEWNTVKIK